MYPSQEARELNILIRISRELDIIGDVSATVDNPSELLAWAAVLLTHTKTKTLKFFSIPRYDIFFYTPTLLFF